jgi:hypothetical protein
MDHEKKGSQRFIEGRFTLWQHCGGFGKVVRLFVVCEARERVVGLPLSIWEARLKLGEIFYANWRRNHYLLRRLWHYLGF